MSRCWAVSLVSLGAASVACGQAVFHGIGHLPGGTNSAAAAVSADGSVVVGTGDSASGAREALIWAGGVLTGLGDLPGGVFESSLSGVSADGLVAVGLGTGVSGNAAVRWSSGPGFSPLPAAAIGANAISADGQAIVGTMRVGASDAAFRWTAVGGLVQISPPSALVASAIGVSADGLVVVGEVNLPQKQAFRWTHTGGMVTLGFLPGGSQPSRALGVTPDGSVVIGHARVGTSMEPFRWTQAGGMVGLGFLPGAGGIGYATGITADGNTIIGRFETTPADAVAFIWTAARGLRPLQGALEEEYGLSIPGWTLRHASAITPDGRTIVGWGAGPQGLEGWVVRLPAPCYANCDGSTAAPVLNVSDFICFQTKYAAGDPGANCDGSTAEPVLNVNDFICFQGAFAAGCP